MEQDIIDSSKYKISIYSLDSRFADSRTSINSEFRVTNPNPIRNVIRLRLSSVEIPLVEHMFSSDKGNISFVVSLRGFVTPYDYVNYTCVIPEGNYTVAGICAAVQTALRVINAGFTCDADPISGFVTIRAAVDFLIDFNSPVSEIARRSTHWGLGYYLGFRVRNLVGTSTGTSTIIVAPNPYYLIQIRCPDSLVSVYHRIDKNAYVEAFAKVILKGNSYQIQFDDGSNLLRKEMTFISPVMVPYFQVRIVDPWGVQVNMLNNDWSLALEVTEVVNSKTYADLSKTFTR